MRERKPVIIARSYPVAIQVARAMGLSPMQFCFVDNRLRLMGLEPDTRVFCHTESMKRVEDGEHMLAYLQQRGITVRFVSYGAPYQPPRIDRRGAR